jgi:hypothetical protein
MNLRRCSLLLIKFNNGQKKNINGMVSLCLTSLVLARSVWTDTPESRAKKARGELREEEPDEKEELDSLLLSQR